MGYANFTSFPAIRAVVFAVHAETDTLLALAVAAIAVAFAPFFRQVALRTQDRGLHILPLPLRRTGKIAPTATLYLKHYRPAQSARTSCKCHGAQQTTSVKIPTAQRIKRLCLWSKDRPACIQYRVGNDSRSLPRLKNTAPWNFSLPVCGGHLSSIRQHERRGPPT